MTSRSGPRVLLVEDDRLAAWTGRRILERMGCRVSEADCCAAAEATWLANPYDLAIVDHRLPDGLGVELIGRIRAAGRRDPVVCLTAESEAISTRDRAALGIRDVVSKPLDLVRFQAVVHANAAPGPWDAGAESGTPAEDRRPRTGRFSLVACPDVLTRETVEGLQAMGGAEPWLALDMTRTHRLEDGTAEALRALAAWARLRNGRLCLAGLTTTLEAELTAQRLDRDLDIAKELDSLEALSRNPIAICERAALMVSAVDEV